METSRCTLGCCDDPNVNQPGSAAYDDSDEYFPHWERLSEGQLVTFFYGDSAYWMWGLFSVKDHFDDEQYNFHRRQNTFTVVGDDVIIENANPSPGWRYSEDTSVVTTVGMNTCWRCCGEPVDDDDDLGLCVYCLEELRYPEKYHPYMSPFAFAGLRLPTGADRVGGMTVVDWSRLGRADDVFEPQYPQQYVDVAMSVGEISEIEKEVAHDVQHSGPAEDTV